MSELRSKSTVESMTIVTRQAIQSYAEAVENHNPLYYSREDAYQAGFDGVLAPPTFHVQYKQIKLAVGSEKWLPQGAVHTKQQAKFCGIVKEGDYLYLSTETIETLDAKGRKVIEYASTAKNQRGEIVYEGNMTNLIPK